MEHARIAALIRQTAPVVMANGDQFTRDLYQHLLVHHPSLRNTFNMAHQANGSQANTLFDAIVLFVTKFDQLETLGANARRIAAKHVSVEVQPADYRLVGDSLLATIRTRLGAGATAEVMTAWELAYERIAQVLIGLETATYQQQQTQPGGWNAFKPFVVTRVVTESAGIRSYYLEPQDGAPLPTYLPGQYISLAVQIPGHPHRQIRQYSLSDAPGQPHYRITVKRGAGPGIAPEALVSNYLHDCVEPGSVLAVHAPGGEFHLVPGASAPMVVLAGGLGITPIMAMLEQLAAAPTPRPVLLVHAVGTLDQHPFRTRLQELAQRPGLALFTLYQFEPVNPGEFDQLAPDAHTGLLTAAHLDSLLTPAWAGADYYCCGPLAFMRHVHTLLTQRGISTCRFEEFGPTRQVNPAPVGPPSPAPWAASGCPYLRPD